MGGTPHASTAFVLIALPTALCLILQEIVYENIIIGKRARTDAWPLLSLTEEGESGNIRSKDTVTYVSRGGPARDDRPLQRILSHVVSHGRTSPGLL